MRDLHSVTVSTAASAAGILGVIVGTSVVCSGYSTGTGSNDWLSLDTAVGNINALVQRPPAVAISACDVRMSRNGPCERRSVCDELYIAAADTVMVLY